MKAIRVQEIGGPEVLRYEDVPIPEPRAKEVLIKTEAIGINYIDVYYRKGWYKQQLPFTLGMEAAGVIVSAGPEVHDLVKGDRVAYARKLGSYAEYAAVLADQCVKVPDNITIQQAAGCMLQGMTAHYLTSATYPIKRGDTILIHAAAGGVGLLVTQMAKMRGAHVIGTVSTHEKAKIAKAAGADDAIVYTEDDFEAGVRRITSTGVDVVYDSVGQATFDKSLKCLRRRGMLVLFGHSSGPVPPIDPQILSTSGSIYLVRTTLADYIATRAELMGRSTELFEAIASKKLRLRMGGTFSLKDAAEAHRQLEGRKTSGKLLLLP